MLGVGLIISLVAGNVNNISSVIAPLLITILLALIIEIAVFKYVLKISWFSAVKLWFVSGIIAYIVGFIIGTTFSFIGSIVGIYVVVKYLKK